MNTITFEHGTAGLAFKVDPGRRQISGVAIPYGDVASSKGQRWSFSAETAFDWVGSKSLLGHEWAQLVGVPAFESTPDALSATIKVRRGALGDDVLEGAEDGVYDGLSVGLADDGLEYETRDGVNYVTAAKIVEVSVTPLPAFARARVTSVAASAVPNKEGTPAMTETATVTEAPASAAFSDEAVRTLTTRLDALEQMATPVTMAAELAIAEEPMYRFHGLEPAPSGFDFATDLYNAAKGDAAALERVQTFTKERLGGAPTFVASGDVNELNQPAYRPDMFMGQAPTPSSPLYDFFHKGALNNVTPFFYSKLDRDNTDVSVHDHTEGVEPSADDLVTVTGATITPTAVSGKVHITREVADQGGNPQVSALVWSEFERTYKIALETKTAALLAASAGSISHLTGAVLTTAGAGDVVGLQLEGGLIDLQFLADGSRFVKGFMHRDLYKLLALFENTEGEKRYPIINPSNRSGIAGDKYAFIDVAGYRFNPIHSLGPSSATPNLSYVADPNAVHVWNSGLTRLGPLQEDVEGWDLGVFGYFAGITYDVTGLRKISYDTTA